jgi:hypothetical protein
MITIVMIEALDVSAFSDMNAMQLSNTIAR